ncbi:MAG: hypothetical protein KOO65_08480 [Desulfobacterales bacterium]|nr:hypothetical protein [Desulfobacterales bacterium]
MDDCEPEQYETAEETEEREMREATVKELFAMCTEDEKTILIHKYGFDGHSDERFWSAIDKEKGWYYTKSSLLFKRLAPRLADKVHTLQKEKEFSRLMASYRSNLSKLQDVTEKFKEK